MNTTMNNLICQTHQNYNCVLFIAKTYGMKLFVQLSCAKLNFLFVFSIETYTTHEYAGLKL